MKKLLFIILIASALAGTLASTASAITPTTQLGSGTIEITITNDTGYISDVVRVCTPYENGEVINGSFKGGDWPVSFYTRTFDGKVKQCLEFNSPSTLDNWQMNEQSDIVIATTGIDNTAINTANGSINTWGVRHEHK